MAVKKSSLDFFFEELQRMQYFIGNDMLQAYQEAKKLHAEEIKEAYEHGEFDCGCNGTSDDFYLKNYGEKQEPVSKKIEIVFNEYNYECGDGCCNTWGLKTTVNGEELHCHNIDVSTQVKQILEHLGYDVSIIDKYNGSTY
jgi:hypothetical protein